MTSIDRMREERAERNRAPWFGLFRKIAAKLWPSKEKRKPGVLSEIRKRKGDRTMKGFTTIELLLGFLGVLVLAWCLGCEERPTVGWDPATMRCRTWEDGKPTGEFLKDEECAGQSKPIILQPEVQP